ncbi:MAG: radical SAM protein [Anaerolineaceae bacterium]|nr:radical SAM protein [Anaerolineaceae bacterium]
MMNNTLDDLYPSLHEDVILHITPAGAQVTIKLPEGTKIGSNIKPIPLAFVNETAREILLLCDGQSNCKSIVCRLLEKTESRDVNFSSMLEGTIDFLQQMMGYKILELGKSPCHCKFTISGSRDFFIPQHMSVELTSNCNLKCIYCYRDAGPHQRDYLEYEDLVGILERLASHGLRSVELTGGEPLLHPQFLKILSYCVTRFERITILTNACLIDKEIAEFAGNHKEKMIFQTDLDGSTAELHDSIRGVPGAFNRAITGIKKLVGEGVRLRVVMNVVKGNVHDIEKTLIFAKELGVTWFTFVPIVHVGRAKNLQKLTVEQLSHFIDSSIRLKQEYKSFIGAREHDQIVEEHKNEINCGMGYKAAVLGPTGRVRPCLLLPESALTIGDLTKESVSDVFSNPVVIFLNQLKSQMKKPVLTVIMNYFADTVYPEVLKVTVQIAQLVDGEGLMIFQNG